MEIIELGGRRARDVYTDLKQRLESIGVLPDEYFSLSSDWNRKNTIPADADIVCNVDYGSNEGIYIDITLRWEENGSVVKKPFITGKTLADTGAALDRMYLTASAVTKAFHGDRLQYAQVAKLFLSKREDMLVSLSAKEQDIFIDALLNRREMLVSELDGTEQLLRRMVGSITEYIDLTGAKPLHMKDYDKALLTIRDGEVEAFKEMYPKLTDRADDLLIETAGRPGRAGRQMMTLLLIGVKRFSDNAYLAATKGAVETEDTHRVKYLMENRIDRTESLRPQFFGEIIQYALQRDENMAKELLDWCPKALVESASPDLLYYAAHQPISGFSFVRALVQKGAPCGERAWEILNSYIAKGDRSAAAILVRDGMRIAKDDYGAFDVCVKGKAVDCAKLILNQGFDFEGYLVWEPQHARGHTEDGILSQIKEYWQSLHPQEQSTSQAETSDDAQQLGGMSL